MRPFTKNRWFLRATVFITIIVPISTLQVNSQSPIAPKTWVVVIDAGHGGKDPGCVGSSSKEKSIALSIALKTGAYIKQYQPDVKIVYTRDDDTFIGLYERADVANNNNADLFISIHANAVVDKRPKGTETYIMGQTMDEENLKLAMKENSVITLEDDYKTKYEGYDPNSAESFIIFSMMQNTYMKQSTDFASLVQNQFTNRVGRFNRGVKQAGYLVLWRTTMPSILVEVGFLSNLEEEKYLKTTEGQEYLASAIFRAFRQYRHTIDSRSGLISSQQAAEWIDEDKVPEKAEVKPDLNTAANTQHKKEVKVPATDDLWFGVQIASSPLGKPKSKSLFKGVDSVSTIESGERYKYIAGKFESYEEASAYRKTMTGSYPDAFVIALRKGKIVPLREAIEEKKKNTTK